MALARTLGTLPFLLPMLLFLLWKREVASYFTFEFFLNLIILLTLEIIATLFYMKGIEISPLSASIPFLSFTPVFVIFTGFFFLGERITIGGLLGILLIVFGAYLLHLPQGAGSLTGPVKAIWKEKGSLFLLATALIYGITSVLGKRGVLLTDPLFFASFYFTLLAVVTPIVLGIMFPSVGGRSLLEEDLVGTLLVGFTQSLMCLFHMLALSLVETAYMIALKRSSILFAVVLGWFIFKEKYMHFRIPASLLMFLGILLIAFFK